MKKHALSILVVMGLAVLATPAAFAQMKADIPFDFTVSAKTLPAGQYAIGRDHSLNVLTLKQVGGPAVEMILPLYTDWGSTTQPKLVFNQYGNRYFLSQLCGIVPGSVANVKPTKAEKEFVAAAAKNAKTIIAAAR